MDQGPATVEERKHDRLRRRRTALMVKYLFVGLVGALLLGQAFGGVVAASRIREVVVQSPDPSVAEEVSQRLHVPPWSNLITSRLSDIARQAEACPRVERAEFRRRFPDRLVLQVQPRKPLLAWERDGRYLLVDDEGVCLYWTDGPDQSLLRVKGVAVGACVGQRISGDWFERCRTAAQAVQPHPEFRPWTLDATTPSELSLITGGGARGVIGMRGDLKRQASLLAEVLADYAKRGKSIGLIELRTDPPIVWDDAARPDQQPGARL